MTAEPKVPQPAFRLRAGGSTLVLADDERASVYVRREMSIEAQPRTTGRGWPIALAVAGGAIVLAVLVSPLWLLVVAFLAVRNIVQGLRELFDASGVVPLPSPAALVAINVVMLVVVLGWFSAQH